jgi:virginiamycin A acetyltransferase
MISIAPDAKVSHLADIEDSTRGTNIIIQSRAVIDSFVKIKPAGGVGDVVIGEGSYINSGVVIYTGNGVVIGRRVLIAANCTIAPVNHEYRSRERPIIEQRFMPSRGGIVIEDDVWIGANTVILDGSYISEGVVVGALSLVRERLEPYCVYGGNPLRRLGQRR